MRWIYIWVNKPEPWSLPCVSLSVYNIKAQSRDQGSPTRLRPSFPSFFYFILFYFSQICLPISWRLNHFDFVLRKRRMQTKRMGARSIQQRQQQHTVYVRIKVCMCVCVTVCVAPAVQCSLYGGIFFFLVPATVCKCLDGVRHAIRRYVTLGNCPDVWLVFSYVRRIAL